ncbi:MAG: class I SAM-dependent methyltransferase, partial [Methanobacteriota archaeon]
RSFWLPALRDVGRLTPGDRILDLGAGTGRYARLLAEFARVVALDLSPDMLLRAAGKGAFNRVRGDAHRLPFRAGAFDATVVVMVLHQIPDYPDVLREVARVSRRIAIATADLRGRSLGILEEAFPSLLPIDRARFPAIEDVVGAVGRAGLSRLVVERRVLHRTLPVAVQLERVRRKYISTLDLIPGDEFERGVAFLERELPRRCGDVYETAIEFTFVGASA